MKHTIKGKHGHHYSLSFNDGINPGEFFKTTPICISASEAARSELWDAEFKARQKISLKWNVCMWCWRPNPTFSLGAPGNPKKTLGLECEACPAWKGGNRRKGRKV